MNYTIRIKRQENQQASPCWQEFSFEGSADTSIASVLNELNHRSPLCEKSGTVVSPIAWECGCMIRKCGACAMRINGLPRLACSVFLRDCKGSVVTLEPLSKFPLVKDLVVDRSVIFEALKRTKLWLEGDAFQTSYTHSQRIDLLSVCSVAAAWRSARTLTRTVNLLELFCPSTLTVF